MNHIKKVKNLNLNGDLAENWKIFKRAFDIFEELTGFDKESDTHRTKVFLNAVGERGLAIYDDLEIHDHEKFEEILKAYETYFTTDRNKIQERFKFNSRNQQENETNAEYLKNLKKIIVKCNFSKAEESNILRDRVIIGIRDKNLQQKLLDTKNLTLKNITEICEKKMLEVEPEKSEDLEPRSEEVSVTDCVIKKLPTYKTTPRGKYFCRKCKTTHFIVFCKVKDKVHE
jgi:hypothetical protein